MTWGRTFRLPAPSAGPDTAHKDRKNRVRCRESSFNGTRRRGRAQFAKHKPTRASTAGIFQGQTGEATFSLVEGSTAKTARRFCPKRCELSPPGVCGERKNNERGQMEEEGLSGVFREKGSGSTDRAKSREEREVCRGKRASGRKRRKKAS